MPKVFALSLARGRKLCQVVTIRVPGVGTPHVQVRLREGAPTRPWGTVLHSDVLGASGPGRAQCARWAHGAQKHQAWARGARPKAVGPGQGLSTALVPCPNPAVRAPRVRTPGLPKTEAA